MSLLLKIKKLGLIVVMVIVPLWSLGVESNWKYGYIIYGLDLRFRIIEYTLYNTLDSKKSV